MQTLGHVDHFEPVLQLTLGIVKVLVLALIDVFLLERAHEALGDPVLLRTAFVTYADVDAVCQQTVDITAKPRTMTLGRDLPPMTGSPAKLVQPLRTGRGHGRATDQAWHDHTSDASAT